MVLRGDQVQPVTGRLWAGVLLGGCVFVRLLGWDQKESPVVRMEESPLSSCF